MRQMTLPGITGRGAFTFERPSPDRLALVLALAIAFISGSLGFLFGRMSIAPVSSGAAVEAVAPKPAQSSKSRSDPAVSKSVRETKLRNDVHSATAQSSASTSPAKEATSTTKDASSPAKEATSTTGDASAPHPVVLLNGPASRHAEKTSETTAPASSSDGTAGSKASNDTSGAANEIVRAAAASGSGSGASSSDGTAGPEESSNDTSSASSTGSEAVRAATAPEPGNDASDADAPAARSEEPATRSGARADAAALDRCASRYRSFRRSDGTYQPYDGGPRKLCQYLR